MPVISAAAAAAGAAGHANLLDAVELHAESGVESVDTANHPMSVGFWCELSHLSS